MAIEGYQILEREFIDRFNKVGITDETIVLFQQFILAFYAEHGRTLPWRETRDPYKILVAEVMLQQTPLARVLQKYEAFIDAFPDLNSLASARLREILPYWQGLGHICRVIRLKKTARIVNKKLNGVFPECIDDLKKLPGIGPATASGLRVFVDNEPIPFMECNIRSVFVHYFFKDRRDVRYRELMPLIEETIDFKNPREWFFALMDYGVMLKCTIR